MQGNDFARTVNVNGAQVYYEYHQHPTAAETFVLLHGFLSSTFSFRRLTPLLKEKYNVISIDLPPFGSSDKSNRFIYSYDNLANTVISLLDHLLECEEYTPHRTFHGWTDCTQCHEKRTFTRR